MWMSLSDRIGLLTLAVMMLFSASEGYAFLHLRCCHRGSHMTKGPIAECYEQKARGGCPVNAYLIKPVSGNWQCIKPDSKWLKKKIEAGQLKCPPDISAPLRKRFEVLDEDDLE
ncbi:uncharacterized protein LOC144537413 [Sander vitreus]